MKFARQFDQMDCGPACIRMVASAYGKDFPLSYLRTLAQLSREGVSVQGIRAALSEIGFDSLTFQLPLSALREQCPLPAILHWEQNHFVVLYAVRKSRFSSGWQYCVADPAYGKHTYTEEEFARHWLNDDRGVVIALEPADDFEQKTSIHEHHSFFRFARKYVWPFRFEMLQSGISLLFGLLLSLIMPFLTQAMVDDGIGLRDLSLIVSILLAQLFIFLGSFSMNLLSSWVSLHMTTRINISILSDYLHKLLQLPMLFFETKSVGDYQQRLADHSRLQNFVTYASLQTFFSLVSAPFYLIIIGSYSLPILCAYLFFTLLSTAWMAFFFRRRKALDYEQFRLSAENQNKQFELLNGITDIKINAYADHKLQEWHTLQERQYAMSRRILKINQVQNTGFALIGQMRNLLITAWIAIEVVQGRLTLGMMMSISAIIGQVNGPLSQLIDFLQQLQDAKISLERSEEVHLCTNEDSATQTPLVADTPLDITLRDVSFSYVGAAQQLALSHLNLTFPAGKMTAIVGESGSGKTTLLKLLLKFYPPTEGEICLGHTPLSQITAASVRQTAGIVMQNNFIFSDTILQNILLGQPLDTPRLQLALHVACLEDFVANLPLGLHTKIGAEGHGISGGEQQRIMIARAVYKQPQYLLLDEATSSLDADNERRITQRIEANFAHRTRIVIAHRLSTVRNADHIIVLQRGKVVEEGTHHALVAKRGAYFILIHNQLELADGQ